jgi:hypothetical protein
MFIGYTHVYVDYTYTHTAFQHNKTALTASTLANLTSSTARLSRPRQNMTLKACLMLVRFDVRALLQLQVADSNGK